MISKVEKPRKLSKLFWAVVFFLVIAAVVIPQMDITVQEDSPRAQDLTDPFDEAVHELDMQYREQGLESLDPQQAVEVAPLLKARSLADVGSVSAEEITAVAEHIESYQYQIAQQPDEARRTTVRNHRNDEILELAPPVYPDRAIENIDEIRADFIDELGVDPSYMTDLPD